MPDCELLEGKHIIVINTILRMAAPVLVTVFSAIKQCDDCAHFTSEAESCGLGNPPRATQLDELRRKT